STNVQPTILAATIPPTQMLQDQLADPNVKYLCNHMEDQIIRKFCRKNQTFILTDQLRYQQGPGSQNYLILPKLH
ncbi:hypothetical protein H4R33_006780, partial [Dimargaris cristalligena]